MAFLSRLMLKRASPVAPPTLLSRATSNAAAAAVREGELMRIAVIGGGVAGLSTALHLAPLVSRGLIAGPVDVYEGSCKKKQLKLTENQEKIGVGIWSSALDGFRSSDRESHQFAWETLTSSGSWIGKVGYRTPDGSWLIQNELPIIPDRGDAGNRSTNENGMPSLLFIQQRDLLSTLRQAVDMEQDLGTIEVHQGTGSAFVTGISNESQNIWSAPLLLGRDATRKTDRDYHLIVGAGGINSRLRKAYQGVLGSYSRLMGTSVLHEYEDSSEPGAISSSASGDVSGSRIYTKGAPVPEAWLQDRQEEITNIEERNYFIFRGNSKLTDEQVCNEVSNNDSQELRSFQTWGEGKSMRFATVPLHYPTNTGEQEERQVWFITIDDDEITKETDPNKRKDMLLSAFKDWHEPICKIVQATPPDEIIMERAIAHKHVASPILKINEIWKQQQDQQHGGDGGPAMVFVGDAFMTVDPILAQGFTVAMEAAKCMSRTVEQTCLSSSTFSSSPKSGTVLSFNPYQLRDEITGQHHKRQMSRIVHLLRATELVGAFSQPKALVKFHKHILRPAMQWTPNFIKQPLFNAVMKYSLRSISNGTSRSLSTLIPAISRQQSRLLPSSYKTDKR